jgi:hypothetical protein
LDSSALKGNGPTTYLELDPNEEAAFVEAFSGYNTPQQILKVLDTIPSQEVTPYVSHCILRKLFELENNFWFRNDGRSWTVSAENSMLETFARMAIVSRLIDTILSSENHNVLLDTLDTLRCERVLENGKGLDYPFSNDSTIGNYRMKLLNEVLTRVTEGQFSVDQVCRAVVSLGKLEMERDKRIKGDLVDKLWVGIVDKSDEIDVHNIVEVFRTVQYFRKSRRLVMNLAEKKMLSLWWRLSPKVVAEICYILIAKSQYLVRGKDNRPIKVAFKDRVTVSHRLLLALSRCASLNIHQIEEQELLQIVQAFYHWDFYDESMEKVGTNILESCLGGL